VEYTYDDDSQLTGLTYKLGGTTLGDLTYAYDANGQRTAVGGSWARSNLPPALTSATYDDANQIASWSGAGFSYDANGNLTGDGIRSYTWNARNELTALTGPVGGSFDYDAIGRRRLRTVGSDAKQYLYDGANPVQELTSGTPVANLLTGLGIDEYFTRTDSAGVLNYLTDVFGSAVGLADSFGTVQAEYTYEPFGSVTASGAPTGNTFGFTGRETDGTGLNYYRARYYDPRLQRFIAEDPIGYLGGLNFHTYVRNDPANASDPFGLQDGAHPVRVGLEWLTGFGPRSHDFKDGDYFAELLRRHSAIQKLISDVCSGKLPPSGDFKHGLNGLAGIPKYFGDYSTLLTLGMTGNIGATFLGSYNGTYSTSGGMMTINVNNPSTIGSAIRPPYFGYKRWWRENIAERLTNAFSSGPMSPTEQSFTLTQNVAGRGCACK
jgi:RHS repeat-associated protein